MRITAKQQDVYDFIVRFKTNSGRFPTYAIIKDYFGFKSSNSVTQYLSNLHKLGLLNYEPKMGYSLNTLVLCPHCRQEMKEAA